MYPIKKTAKSIMIASLVIFLFTNSYAQQTEKSKYNFRKTRWGMTKQQVKATEPIKIANELDSEIVYLGSVASMDAMIGYIFDGGKLIGGSYQFIEKNTNDNDYIYDFYKLLKVLTRKYSTPVSNDHHVWFDDFYKDNPNKRGFAIRVDHLAYQARWETDRIEILLSLYGDDYKIHLEVLYSCKKLQHLGEEEQRKKELE